jgi:hypothetical protein
MTSTHAARETLSIAPLRIARLLRDDSAGQARGPVRTIGTNPPAALFCGGAAVAADEPDPMVVTIPDDPVAGTIVAFEACKSLEEPFLRH